MVPNQDDRVDGLEPRLKDAEQTEAHGCVHSTSILVRDNPSENPSRAEHPKGLAPDMSHFFIESRVAARNASEATGIAAVCDIVRVRRIDHRQSSSLGRQGPRARIGSEDGRTAWRDVE